MAVSIKDVGRLAGVSVSTVSRAFNGYSDINPVTKQRILEAAEALGYSPNISARNLSSKKKQNIGLVISGFLQENTAQARNDEFEFWLMHGAYRLLLSSKIGPVLANNFPPQLLKNLFSVSEAPALIIKVQYLALMRQPVQQSCCEDSVAKKLRPAIKAFI